MIKKLYTATKCALFWRKACDLASQSRNKEALFYLDKYRQTSSETFNPLILRGFLNMLEGEYEEAVRTMKMAVDKINKTKRLNPDEKKYLKAFSLDVINYSIVNGGAQGDVAPVDLSFNISNVDQEYRKRFKVIMDNR